MKFTAAALMAVVLFAGAGEAHRSKVKHGHNGKKNNGSLLRCNYVEDASDRTSERLYVVVGQRASRTDPNTNSIKITGTAKYFDAENGDMLTLKSFDAAGCTGTEKTITDRIRARVWTNRYTG